MKHLYLFPGMFVWSLLLLLSMSSKALANEPFVPGGGGTLPTFTEFQPIEGKVGGFLVYSSIRHNDWFGTGTYAEVEMSFPDAATLGAETLVLQYKKTDGTWASLLNNDQEITTTGNNFSLNMYQTYTLRLLLRGGAKSGYVSNEQTAALSTVNTYFSQVTLDESMFLTGVMAPWVGRGLQVSYVVKKLSDGEVVNGGLSYQWCRVNPVTYEATLIPGADSLLYATTNADLGYKLLVKATGNETTVGGFYQMMSSSNIVSPNKCQVANQVVTGFTLFLHQDLPKIDTGELILRDKDWAKVPIASVTREGSGVFQVTAALSMDKNPYYLQNKSNFWRICTEMAFGQIHDLMEGVSIDLTTNTLPSISNEADLNLIYDVGSKQIRFKSASTVQSVTLFNLAGKRLGHWALSQSEGALPTENVVPGLYMLRFTGNVGSFTRKIQITK